MGLFLMYLNAAFTRYDNARPKCIILNWKQNLLFLFLILILQKKILVNYRIFPWLFIKGFLKISFKMKVLFYFI